MLNFKFNCECKQIILLFFLIQNHQRSKKTKDTDFKEFVNTFFDMMNDINKCILLYLIDNSLDFKENKKVRTVKRD